MDTDGKAPNIVSLLARFEGEGGKELLLEIISESTLIRGSAEIEVFLAGCEIIEIARGKIIIEQGGADNDLYIILSGSFDIAINGRKMSTRHIGAHLGEMALIDPTARRSASAIAAENSLVLKSTETHFSFFANANPKLWRRIAVELSRRLSERNNLIQPPRSEPVLFIGCSTEGLNIAREVQSAYNHDPIVSEIWTDGIFNASKTPLEDLLNLIKRIDFGVLLFTPDDKIKSRKEDDIFGPRDNVIFELGLVMGAIGRDRTFILASRGVELKLPSDLLGVRLIDYPNGEPATIAARLGPACHEIRKLVEQLGPI